MARSWGARVADSFAREALRIAQQPDHDAKVSALVLVLMDVPPDEIADLLVEASQTLDFMLECAADPPPRRWPRWKLTLWPWT